MDFLLASRTYEDVPLSVPLHTLSDYARRLCGGEAYCDVVAAHIVEALVPLRKAEARHADAVLSTLQMLYPRVQGVAMQLAFVVMLRFWDHASFPRAKLGTVRRLRELVRDIPAPPFADEFLAALAILRRTGGLGKTALAVLERARAQHACLDRALLDPLEADAGALAAFVGEASYPMRRGLLRTLEWSLRHKEEAGWRLAAALARRHPAEVRDQLRAALAREVGAEALGPATDTLGVLASAGTTGAPATRLLSAAFGAADDLANAAGSYMLARLQSCREDSVRAYDAAGLFRAVECRPGTLKARSAILQYDPRPSSALPHECIVCMDYPRSAVAVSCGHISCCVSCSRQLTKCPVCSSRTRFLRVYVC